MGAASLLISHQPHREKPVVLSSCLGTKQNFLLWDVGESWGGSTRCSVLLLVSAKGNTVIRKRREMIVAHAHRSYVGRPRLESQN